MTLQLAASTCADPEVDERYLWGDRYDNKPMVALYDALYFFHDRIELVMGLIMDRRCGIERRAEAGLPQYLQGKTPLVFAIYAARVDVAKALLAAGADPNSEEDLYDNSPLLIAAGEEGTLEAIESLISYGADINAVDEEGSTPLHVAVRCGHPSAMELLVRSGANLEAVDNEGCTPLHVAAFSNKAGAVMALLKLGANQAAVDNKGRTPLHVVAEHYHFLFYVIEAFRFNVSAFEALPTMWTVYHSPIDPKIENIGQKSANLYYKRQICGNGKICRYFSFG